MLFRSQGQHYCNCDSDCLLYPEICACEEAQACCTTYIDKSQYTPCIVCPGGLQNPWYYIDLWDLTCDAVAGFVFTDLEGNGTPEYCEQARGIMKSVGCECKGESNEASNNCSICEHGFENPQYFVEDWVATCLDIDEYIKYTSLYDDADQCEEFQSEAAEELGCVCKSAEITNTTEGANLLI